MNALRPLLSVDLFAGGGGASEGIRLATGRAPRVAVNHCAHAIAMHAENHPETIHLQESVHDVEPLDHVRGMPVDLLWASPDCTHFSRAKGGKPRKQSIRALAWVVVDWARVVAPEVIILENVSEFQTWGPLDAAGKPIKARQGETFRAFVEALREAGYQVEWRVLAACDYGAPTTRERLFLVARRGFRAIRWPTPTHGPGRALPWRTAAECIDWSIPSCSIFATPAEAKAWRKRWAHVDGVDGTPRRPLAEATMRRIAEGLRRFVLEAGRPFVVNLTHGGRLDDIDDPMKTITAAHRGEKALVEPWVVATGHQSSDGGKVRGVAEPLSTVVTKAEHLVCTPHLVNTRNGERQGQAPRVRDIERPLGTVTAQGSQGGLVQAWLAKHYGGPNGHPCYGQGLDQPVGSVTGRDSQGPVVAELAQGVGGRAAAVAGFLVKYYGEGGQWSGLGEPMHTIVSKARMGLVTVELGGEQYVITDIAMRMLQPRELARAQGFPDSYILSGTKSQQVARIGNSVCPPVVQALVEAQFGLAGRAVERVA